MRQASPAANFEASRAHRQLLVFRFPPQRTPRRVARVPSGAGRGVAADGGPIRGWIGPPEERALDALPHPSFNQTYSSRRGMTMVTDNRRTQHPKNRHEAAGTSLESAAACYVGFGSPHPARRHGRPVRPGLLFLDRGPGPHGEQQQQRPPRSGCGPRDPCGPARGARHGRGAHLPGLGAQHGGVRPRERCAGVVRIKACLLGRLEWGLNANPSDLWVGLNGV